MSSLSDNLARVRERVAQAALRAGRQPEEICLVAVTKTHPPEVVAAAARAGQMDFGENRIAEASGKMALSPAGLRWHMIGHIQSRKAREVIAGRFHLVHSVDSLRLAERLSRHALDLGRIQPVLLECNVSGEAGKQGFAAFDPARWAELLGPFQRLAALTGLQVDGLMTMAPILTAPDAARPYFARLRALGEFLRGHLPEPGWKRLSMGMTDDFEAAIAEGATHVRVGRAIFGER